MAYRTQTGKEQSSLQPPQDLELERAVLGAVLKDEDAISRVIDILQDETMFYSPKHQYIYGAILNLYSKSEPVDITTVAAEMRNRGHMDKVGGQVYLVELVEQVASIGNVASWAKRIMDKGILRRLITASNDITQSCYDLKLDVTELLDMAEANIFALSESRLRQGFEPLKSLLTATLEQIEQMQVADGGLSGIKTGFRDIDNKILGLSKGDLIIIAGRPSMGKTSLAMNMAENVATADREEDRKKVGIFSVEMSKEQLVFRLLCSHVGLDQQKVRSGKLADDQWHKLATAGNVLSQAPIYVDDSPTLSPLDLRAKARRLKAQHGLDLIIVDYIQLMHASLKAENRQQEISMISRNLKSLAKELEIPVIALSQLSRAVEQRGGDKRPQLADLRESGAIEQDADVVMLLYRPEVYHSHLEKNDPKLLEVQGWAEVNIAKNRNGPTGSTRLTFRKELTRFEDMAWRRDDLPPGIEPVSGPPTDSPF